MRVRHSKPMIKPIEQSPIGNGYSRTGSQSALSRVIHGPAGIRPNLAVRLACAGVSTARFWMILQNNDELSPVEQAVEPKIQPWQLSGYPKELTLPGI